MAAADALNLYPQVFSRKRAGERKKLWNVLSGKNEFGPRAVAGIKDAAFLEAVGRGLAYNLLHEFWHATERRSDHPFDDQANTIESEPSPLPKALRLRAETRKNIERQYELTWCRYIAQRRVNLGEIKI
jgi:hypothetical protein